MRSLRTLAVVGAAAAAVVGTAMGSAQAATQQPQRLPGYRVPVVAGPAATAPTLVRDTTARAKARPTAQFIVTYHGFTPAAQAAFQRAVDMWATKVTSSVPVTVDATWQALAPGYLGWAGSSYIWNNGGAYDVDAIANKKAGYQRDSSPDIVASFSSTANWNLGPGPAPLGQYDLETVVAHELGHGLGFLGAGKVTSGLGTVKNQGVNYRYDWYTRLGTGGTWLANMPDNSAQLGSALTSSNVYFDSNAVRAANGGSPAKLYAPSTWKQGSSYLHLDEATYPAGTINSMMTYSFSDGETIRTPGPIALAVFGTIGW